ncbi:MAG TPA: hypothetical protein VK442_06040 [Xanthobacteraceae bacterium]|nr:hypothetical protein [Xanthobacteraceae bacterium]
MVARGKAEQQAARSARLAAALRENLKRRKAQARGRAQNRPADAAKTGGNGSAEPAAPDFRRNRGSD